MDNRLLIVEEALRDQKAHWYSYISTIVDAAKEEGWSVEVACNIKSEPLISEKLSSFQCFKYSVYLDSHKKKLPGERYYSFILHSFRTLRVLWPLLKKQDKYEQIFVPTVLVQHLLAWLVVMVFHSKRPNRLTLFFVTNPGIWNREIKKSCIPKSALLIKYLIKCFALLVKKSAVTLAVETQGAKEEFESLAHLPFQLLPHPVSIPGDDYDIQNDGKNQTNQRTIFACFGFARHEKGSDLLKDAIEKILTGKKSVNACFIVQWTDPFKMPDGSLCTPGELLSNHRNVTIINTALNEDQYLEMLKKISCMILPYRNSSYHARVSRVAIEAACYAIPMIYTKAGWLEELVSGYGAGISIEDESIDELINAIVQMNTNIDVYRMQAEVKSIAARKYFSPESFVQKLFNS